MEKLSEQEIIALREINDIYTEPMTLSIKQIKYEDNTLNVLLGRPGLLIGRGGELVGKLRDNLRLKFDNPDLTIKIIESNIDNYFERYDNNYDLI